MRSMQGHEKESWRPRRQAFEMPAIPANWATTRTRSEETNAPLASDPKRVQMGKSPEPKSLKVLAIQRLSEPGGCGSCRGPPAVYRRDDGPPSACPSFALSLFLIGGRSDTGAW